MIKKFKMTIEILVDIPDQISPNFIKQIIKETDKENRLPNYQPPIDKIQAFVDYIKNRENILEECLTGDLYFNLSSDGFTEELTHFLNPKTIDQIALENATELDNDLKDFIITLYKDTEDNEKFKIDEDGKLLPNSRQNIEDDLESEIHTEIIQQTLLNYKITAASLKEVSK